MEKLKKPPTGTMCRICGKPIFKYESSLYSKVRNGATLWFHEDCYRKEEVKCHSVKD